MNGRNVLRSAILVLAASLLMTTLAAAQTYPPAAAPPPPTVKAGDTAPDFTANYFSAADANGRRERKAVRRPAASSTPTTPSSSA
jgi:hypothetical protein